MKKLFKIAHITSEMKKALVRFPLSLSAAFLATIVGVFLVHVDEPGSLPNILMMLILAFPVFLAIQLYRENYELGLKSTLIVDIVATLFLFFYYWLLPPNIWNAYGAIIFRYVMWAVGFVLLVMFIPFVRGRTENSIRSFWQYNQKLCLSLVLTLLWAGVLQLGLSAAMGSVDFLFNINIDGDRYLELWIVLLGVFSTLFFTSRIPKSEELHKDGLPYSKEIKLFAQYVLTPLTSIYFLILYAYVVRIFIISEWPEGVLAYMIIGFSFVGILALVLLYPLRATVVWVKKMSTIFYAVLIPQTGMLFWTLWIRVSEYGITENRYFVFIFGAWLLGMALYFLVSKKHDITYIPLTLFVLALLTSFGPWGTFAVSENSQRNRLEGILFANDMLVEGDSLVKQTDLEVSFEDRKQISAIVDYLVERHGVQSIQDMFVEDLSNLRCEEYYPTIMPVPVKGDVNSKDAKVYDVTCRTYDVGKKIVEDLMDVVYVSRWEARDLENGFFNSYIDMNNLESGIDVSEYDRFKQVSIYTRPIKQVEEKDDINVRLISDNTQLRVVFGDGYQVDMQLDEIFDRLKSKNYIDINLEDVKLKYEDDSHAFSLYLNQIVGTRTVEGVNQIESLQGYVFYGIQ